MKKMSIGTVPGFEKAPPRTGHFEHSVQFYGEDSSLLDESSRFIGTHLVSGDAAVVIATKAHRDGIAQRLQSRGFDLFVAVTKGRYIALDAAETLARFMRNGRPDAKLFGDVIGVILAKAAATGGDASGVAAFGEMVALLWAEGNAEAAVQLEHLWNDLGQNFLPFSLHCAYPISDFSRGAHGESFLEICKKHSHVIPVESYTELIGDDARLRSISQLQQKAQALENEMAERKQVEETLRQTKADLELQVEERTAALRRLSSRLLSMQDSERRRIARELHDSLGQYLVGLKLNAHMLRQSPQREDLWSEADRLMEQCIAEVRTLSYLLHPPTMDAAGFASAARWYVEGYSQRSGLKVRLDAPADPGRLPDAIELALFRVLQEALTNVHRHSGASAADVLIQQDAEQIVMEIRDNGCGMPEALLDQSRATGAGVGVGIMGIRERVRELAGKLTLESNSNGTLLRVAIPVQSEEHIESQTRTGER
jgi:signal transduction histidine kinase